MDERWRLESTDSELKFFFDESLVIHLFKFNQKWQISVLGHERSYESENLSEAIKIAETTAIECGWIQK